MNEEISTASPTDKRRIAVTVVLLLLLAALLRLPYLGTWGMWSDEVSTLRDSANLSNVRGYPIGYFLIGLVIKQWGNSEFAARMLPTIIGIISVPVLFLIGRRMLNERAGLFAAMLLALSSYHIFFSQFARYYTLLMLFSMLMMWLAYEALERNSIFSAMLAALLFGLAGLTHWSAGFLAAAICAYLLWHLPRRGRPRGMNWRNILILFLPVIAGGLIFARSAISLLGEWRGEQFSFLQAGLTILKLGDRMEPAAILIGAPVLLFLVGLRERWFRWLLCWSLIPCILTVAFIGFAQGGTRFAFMALPAFMLMAGAGLETLLQRFSNTGYRIVLALALLTLLSLGLKDALYFFVEHGQRPRWKEASLRAMQEEHNVFATTPQIFDYYASRFGNKRRASSLEELKNALPGDYVIVEQTANVAPSAEEREFIAARGELVEEYPLRVRLLNYGVSVYRVAPFTKETPTRRPD